MQDHPLPFDKALCEGQIHIFCGEQTGLLLKLRVGTLVTSTTRPHLVFARHLP
jgi:hypothetical protein